MKKITLVLLSVVMLLGCGKSQEPEQPAETKEPAPVQVSEVPETPAIETKTLSELLQGSWKLLPKGELYSNETTGITVTFEDNKMMVKDMIRNSDSVSEITFGDIYDIGEDNITKITVDPKEAHPAKASEADVLSSPVDFQVLYANHNQTEFLALRELGNGISYFGMDQLNIDFQDLQYFWIFVREPEELDEAAEELIKDDTFYAFCWVRDKETVSLQKVDTESFEEQMYEEETTALKLIPDYTTHRFALDYPVAEDIQWRILPNSNMTIGSISPYLVRVTTGKDGTVTVFDYMDYLGYGFYEATESSMFRYGDLLPYDDTNTVFAYKPGDLLTNENDLVYADTGAKNGTEVIFFTRKNLNNFRILSLTYVDEGTNGIPVFDAKEVFQTDRFYPEHPISAKLSFIGSIPNNGICYTELDGTEKYYALSQSGMDGSYELEEITISKG